MYHALGNMHFIQRRCVDEQHWKPLLICFQFFFFNLLKFCFNFCFDFFQYFSANTGVTE